MTRNFAVLFFLTLFSLTKLQLSANSIHEEVLINIEDISKNNIVLEKNPTSCEIYIPETIDEKIDLPLSCTPQLKKEIPLLVKKTRLQRIFSSIKKITTWGKSATKNFWENTGKIQLIMACAAAACISIGVTLCNQAQNDANVNFYELTQLLPGHLLSKLPQIASEYAFVTTCHEAGHSLADSLQTKKELADLNIGSLPSDATEESLEIFPKVHLRGLVPTQGYVIYNDNLNQATNQRKGLRALAGPLFGLLGNLILKIFKGEPAYSFDDKDFLQIQQLYPIQTETIETDGFQFLAHTLNQPKLAQKCADYYLHLCAFGLFALLANQVSTLSPLWEKSKYLFFGEFLRNMGIKSFNSVMQGFASITKTPST